tara:strand:+ start:1762 stop:2724 length:963 start_codon:yes stop_codon:yes gene_type:complete
MGDPIRISKIHHKLIPPMGKTINDIGGYTIYDRSVDIYDNDTGKLLCKFRKSYKSSSLRKATEIKNDNIKKFIVNIKSLIIRKKENRSFAAGEIDRDKLRKSVGELYNTKSCRTGYYTLEGKKSATSICNYAKSNVIGYIDTAARNRKNTSERVNLAAYCRDHPDRYEACKPLLNDLDMAFKEIDYERHYNQHNLVENKYRIGDTAFSTCTVNYSWQSAAHLDANNGEDCFAVIAVLKDHLNDNDYTGGFLLFPEYNIGFNIRQKDVFIGDTVNNLHCNSPLVPVKKEIVGKFVDIDIKNNWYLNRISIVAYIKKSCLLA